MSWHFNNEQLISQAQIVLSLGKSAADIITDFVPVPGLSASVGLLCMIMKLTENVIVNKHQARQLRDRCHTLLQAAKDAINNVKDTNMANAFQKIEETLSNIQKNMDKWAQLRRVDAFLRQKEIKDNIQRHHSEISDCFHLFEVVSQVEIYNYLEEFESNAARDQKEMMTLLSNIHESQTLIRESQSSIDNKLENTNVKLEQIMALMQTCLSETKHNADQIHNGLAVSLYNLQQHTKLLLPKLNLESGEVLILTRFPISSTSTMDIYEGLYLNQEKVTIKMMRAVNSNEKSKARFMREVRVWNEVWTKDKGKHVLPFYGFCQLGVPYPFMISPWQEHGTALEYVKQYDLTVDYQRMIMHISRGVQVLHEMKIVHGNIKASNIMISPSFEPLLADFGLSKIVEDLNGIPFTQSQGVADSYRWFAPEVCTGEGILSTSSDIYALGMTIIELFTHQRPFSNIKNLTHVIIQCQQGQLPERPSAPEVLQRGLDDHTWALLKDSWKIAAVDRPKIDEVISRLNSV
ncbi:kinase-like protein [Gymnopus androsaceus JB14]|uniref:Kinase-like protein n=1 Tax=Gymnopus androsaceus JB14 TaxID=1447944 RepID=A0A6A4H7J1_9AGAR|nr:kinase-like protein [Gymnopus androsaceus JB14]